MDVGARIWPNAVNAYDFESTLCSAAGIAERELPLFDLVFSHGFHFSTFNDSPIANRQFQYLRSTHIPATCILAEAVHGQSAGSLFLGMHYFEYLNRAATFPSSLNVASRCYLPDFMESQAVAMKLRSSDRLHKYPLWAIVNGPLAADAVRYTVRTRYAEDQLDVFSMIYNTLRDGSHVIQLGCGELRFAKALLTWLSHGGTKSLDFDCSSLPGLKGSHDLGSWRKWVPTPCSGEESSAIDVVMGPPDTPRSNASETMSRVLQSYRDFVIMKPGDSLLEGTVGRVNLPRLATWCSSLRMQYRPQPAPLIQRQQGPSADSFWPIQTTEDATVVPAAARATATAIPEPEEPAAAPATATAIPDEPVAAPASDPTFVPAAAPASATAMFEPEEPAAAPAVCHSQSRAFMFEPEDVCHSQSQSLIEID